MASQDSLVATLGRFFGAVLYSHSNPKPQTGDDVCNQHRSNCCIEDGDHLNETHGEETLAWYPDGTSNTFKSKSKGININVYIHVYTVAI